MATTEERLAALEKQMAAWIDQQPTTYYTHQYSGEEIDAAVGRARTGGALDTSVTNVSNQLGTFTRPNLLDNWYFGNPINQRGQTEYTGNGYTVDRWFFDTDSGSSALTLTTEGLKFIATASATGIASLKQDIDPTMLSVFAGKTVTLSILGKTDISQQVLFYVNSKVAVVKSSPAVNGVCMTTLTYTFPSVLENAAIFVYGRSYSGAGEGTILAAKLELGPTQTLAHREGDRWLLNEVPDYGEQLRRCQRYFWRLHGMEGNKYAIFAYGMKQSADQVRFVIPFPATFRVSPAITANGKFLVSDGTKDYAVDSIGRQSFNGESIVLVAKLSTISALPNGTLMRFGAFNDPGAYVDFSADL